jgi:hypothetical protein
MSNEQSKPHYSLKYNMLCWTSDKILVTLFSPIFSSCTKACTGVTLRFNFSEFLTM